MLTSKISNVSIRGRTLYIQNNYAKCHMTQGDLMMCPTVCKVTVCIVSRGITQC